MKPKLPGYLRQDGRKGIRNHLLVVYLVECARHVADEIFHRYRDRGVQLVGFSGCYPNEYSNLMLQRLCTHPNVGGALLVSLGCEGFDRNVLLNAVEKSGRPVSLVGIQNSGGTRRAIDEGCSWIEVALDELSAVPRCEMGLDELVVGTICGGSDATSGMTANPAVGHCFDRLVEAGATAIFEETGELIGCENWMADRAERQDLAEELIQSVAKAARYYDRMGHGSFAPGNADGGLTTQEEKSLGAYTKSGSAPISGLLKPGDVPARGGLYLLDVVPDGEVIFGFPNINDNAEIAELIACGSHLILFTTGRGSVVGSVISPVIKICGNPETCRHMAEDIDIDAGKILQGAGSIQSVGDEIFENVLETASGRKSVSESLGHQEFVLTYKKFQPLGPACFPA